jgi:PKD domain
VTTAVSPSGRRVDRFTNSTDLNVVTTGTAEFLEIASPELGRWTIETLGAEVVGAEPVRVLAWAEPTSVPKPAVRLTQRVITTTPLVVEFDATGTLSTDGSPIDVTWNFGDGTFETAAVLL